MTKQKKMTAVELLDKYKPQLAAVVPDHIKIDKLIRVCQSQINSNPDLGMVEPAKLMAGIMRCAQLGLEPGAAFSKVHLIPFNNRKKGTKELNVIVGYQGLIELARRSGEVSEIYAETIRANDNFEISHGLNRDLKHSFDFGKPRGEIIGSYAVCKYKDGGHHFITLDLEELEAVRTRSKYPNPIWKSDTGEMAKKTAIRRLAKLMPLTSEKSEAFNQAASLEIQAETEVPQENETILIEAGVPLPKSYDKDETAPNMFDRTKSLLSEAIKNGFSCKEIFGADAASVLADCKNDEDCITIVQEINKFKGAK